ncbi:hypothetical protein [Rhodococcus sp. 1139]|uniref:hypothetical protein n=1 Tax=Rhodococcus sp. 1139 TaxID=1833762 RepID=UPI000871D092|nr:hypothetical protein [Rhodococcus sp. 1139]OFE08008.1 hypothetical protein A5N83_14875 [Rhodococcus sp. 1139]
MVQSTTATDLGQITRTGSPGPRVSVSAALSGNAGRQIHEAMGAESIASNFSKVRSRLDDAMRERFAPTREELLAHALDQAASKQRVSETLLDDLAAVDGAERDRLESTAGKARALLNGLHSKELARRVSSLEDGLAQIIDTELRATLAEAVRVFGAIEGIETAEQAITAGKVEQWQARKAVATRWMDVQRTRLWLDTAIGAGFGDIGNPHLRPDVLARSWRDSPGRLTWSRQFDGVVTADDEPAEAVLRWWSSLPAKQRPEPLTYLDEEGESN